MEATCKYLNSEKLTRIQLSLEQGWTKSREFKRNGWSDPATTPKMRGQPLRPVAVARRSHGNVRTVRREGLGALRV